MIEEYEDQRRKQIAIRRSIMDYCMGGLFFLLGLLFLLHKSIGFEFGNNRPLLDIVFGTMCVLYGSWRIYRGYKKNYFN